MENICAICKAPLTSVLIPNLTADGDVYDVYYCETCGVGVTLPMPSQTSLSKLYSAGAYRAGEGKRFNPAVELFIYLSRLARKRRIERYGKSGRILDIGCGRGLFLDVMKRAGWSVAGTEFDEDAASRAGEAYGIDVVTGDAREWGFEEGSFDVITMNHVLEHLQDPAGMIAECRRLLKKGGLLVCAVPNLSGLQARAGRGLWFHLDVPYHVHHFTEEGLAGLLRRYSFRIVRKRHFDMEYNPFGWLQTLLNLTGIRRNLLYGILKSPYLRRREIEGARKGDILLTFVLLPLYLPLSFLLSLAESLCKRGGTVEVYAVKE